MEPGTFTVVLRDFITVQEGELSLNKGEYFLIYKIEDKHWCSGQSNNKFGKFPSSNLMKVELPATNDDETIFVTIAPFYSKQPGDLSFAPGEIIVGNTKAPHGWFSGCIGPRKGMFPANHVWQLDFNVIQRLNKETLKKKNFVKKARVKANLEPQLDEELKLVEGDIVIVTEVLDDGWCRGRTDYGRVGIFPESFITYLDDENDDQIDANLDYNNFNTHSISPITANYLDNFKEDNMNTISQDVCDDAPISYDELFPDSKPKYDDYCNNVPHQSSSEPHAITLFPFVAQFPNELSFEAGQEVKLIKHVDNHWTEGEIDNVRGIFPVSYVNIIIDCVDSQTEKSNEESNEISNEESNQIQDFLKPNDFVKVEFKFDAQMDGDLSVSEGEILTVVEMVNADWVTVKNNAQQTGLCPRSYLTVCENLDNEEHNSTLEDFVVIRNKDDPNSDKVRHEIQSLSEPHRPAPPAPSPGRSPLKTSSNQSLDSIDKKNCESIDKKREDQRKHVISELFITEKDFLRDMKITFETFNLHRPSFLESRGIDVMTLFGNINEIIQVSEELLNSLQVALNVKDEYKQTIGESFLNIAEKMKTVYGKYCNNYESALVLLQKYEENKDIMRIFDKAVETLKMQIICFDVNSILIKPVQRVLKYPLILNELFKCTDDHHPDKPTIQEAATAMTAVATHINEYKRKREISSKYLNSNSTIIGRMANLNMHTLSKKSSRLGAKLSATLGLTNLQADSEFEDLVKDFMSLEKNTKQLLKDVELCISNLDNESFCSNVLVEQLHQYFTGSCCNEILQLLEVGNITRSNYLPDFKKSVEQRVILPLNNLIPLLSGPELLIQKRHDKMLDYDTEISRSEKTKERGSMTEDLMNAKSNFEALNQQLLEELPIFIKYSTVILNKCIHAFAYAFKVYNAKIMKNYLVVMEATSPVLEENIQENFFVYHTLLYNQINRLCYGGTNARLGEIENRDSLCCMQSPMDKEAVRQKYPPNKVYVVTQSVNGATSHDLSVTRGTLVGVIKTQDPMGNTSKWFVDNGASKGFVDYQYLKISEEVANFKEENTNNCAVSPVSSEKDKDSIYLMSLDSPEKKSNYSVSRYLNLDDNFVEAESENIYQNISNEFVYALYDFNNPNLQGTLSITEGQALKVIKKHDHKNNDQWWLVEDRQGNKGYVPHNYVGKKEF
ncbi:dynamin-binding protein-like isoform X1 [Trichogramma pretiosum]|uniref:dynamin-binding protein-like isoform X1 n=1 Tax=Trichogramma pretiosum TaxID=7493 RepID=UPI0006C9C342|nr:dynamin-binding protein-like isoform X1 [Trichogramma pretiosum]